MPIPNTDYNPQWQELHDLHMEKYTALEAEMDKINAQKSGVDRDTEEADKLWDKWDDVKAAQEKHLQIRLRCMDTYQHKTIQDKARWIFESCGIEERVRRPDLFANIDYESFKTHEDVYKAWNAAIEEANKTIN